MKRIHIGLAVADLEPSIRFYSALFGTGPTVVKDDYAKWMLEDPRVNFSLTAGREDAGDSHFGIDVDDREDLEEITARMKAADQEVIAEGDTVCCYHRSEKAWVVDPQGARWEAFLTSGESEVYGHDTPELRASLAKEPS